MERFRKQVLDESDYMATVKLATTVRNIIKIFLMPVAFWVACVIAVYKWTWKTIGW